LPTRLQRHFDDSEITPAGRSFYEPHDRVMRTMAQQVTAEPGKYTVDIHGNTSKVFIGSDALNPDDLSHLLHNDPHWDQHPIRLLSCETGQHPEGSAQQLADRLGVEVTAPDQLGWSTSAGHVYSATGTYDKFGNLIPTDPPDGIWTTFRSRRNP
jgi:hypothetical protein